MTIPNTFTNGTVADANEVNANFTHNDGLVPVGAIISWAKTFLSRDSGTTDGTTTNKLVDSSQNFTSTVSVGDLIHNTTDSTFAYVTAIDSNTQLSIDADIMVSGEAYTIYATPALSDNFVECKGQTLSDGDSRFNGATIPDLNGGNRFLRGSSTSGATGGSEEHNHQWFGPESWQANGTTQQSMREAGFSVGGDTLWWKGNEGNDLYTKNEDTKPPYYEVVWIMRIK